MEALVSQSIRRALFKAKGLPDPGPTPSVEMTQLTILIPRKVAKAIDELHAFVESHFPSRNDFLEELLREGLGVALQSQKEAIAALEAMQREEARPAIEVETDHRPAEIINNPALEPQERERISARLRALRGEPVGAVAVERASKPDVPEA
jgi:hypothetical protein